MMLTPNGPTKHVYFAGSRGDGSFDAHFHKFWWDGDWHHNDLTSNTGAPLSSSDPWSSYMFRGEGTKHVIYPGLDNHIHELWWDGNWHYNDLTSATHNAPVAIFPAFGYEYSFGGTISPLAVTAVPLGLLGSTVPSDSRGRTTAIRATSA